MANRDKPDDTDLLSPAPDPDAEDDTLEYDDETAQAVIDLEAIRRLWIRTLVPLLQLRSHDTDPSGRVQLAFDLMHIAACERVARVLRSDLPSD